MFQSWKLGNAFGINIYVHWTFLFLPAWVLLEKLGIGGWEMAVIALGLLGAVFGCIVLHELGHAMAALRFGIRTREITLYPIGGVARLERMSEKPWEELVIALAGPAINVIIAGALGAFLLVSGYVEQVVALPPLGMAFLSMLMVINALLAAFNMLPAFPMDGGRVLRALLALRVGHVRATAAAVGIGQIVALAMALVGLFTANYPLVLVAAFIWLVGKQELAGVYYREIQREARRFGFGSSEEPRRGPVPVRVSMWDPKTGTWVTQGPLRAAGSGPY